MGDKVATNVHYPYSIVGEVVKIEQEFPHIDHFWGQEETIRFSKPLYHIRFDYTLIRKWYSQIKSNVFRDELKPGVNIIEFPPYQSVLKLFADEFTVLKQEEL